VLPVKPRQCRRCQHPLQGDDPQPYRHQVTELPPIRPVVTEYQIHRLLCPACGVPARADLPLGVPPGGFGPRVQAIVALCTGAYRLSKRTTQELMADLFGLPLSLGTILIWNRRRCRPSPCRWPKLRPMAGRNPSPTSMRRAGVQDEPARGCRLRSPRGSPASWPTCRVAQRWRRPCWGNGSVASW
jgi:hypothetical protein